MDLNSSQSDLAAGRQAQLAGFPSVAMAIFEKMVAANPADHEAHYWLASAKLTAGDPGAAQAMEDARALHALLIARALGVDVARARAEPAYAAGIATDAYSKSLVAVSATIRGLALAAGQIDAMGLLNYGLALQHQGRVDDACDIFRAAVDNFPSAQLHQFLLFPLLFRTDGVAEHAAESRAWAKLYAPGVAGAAHANPDRKGRKLRIGYMAPNFAGTQLRQFIAPILENHDPEAVEVTLYPNAAETETGWPPGVRIRPIGALGDADAAALIRADGIDVLADCWGHTAGSRLPVMALKPAPVQVAWVNFLQTTGLPQVDYVLHADGGPPEDGLYTEKLWRIGPVFNVFRPADGRLPPVPTPALSTGQVTFGSFNHPAKLGDPVLDAWAAILRGAPGSRLLLKYGYFDDPVLQRVTQARFAARGVAPERIHFEGQSKGEDYYRSFQQVDLMLDTWPATGSTTTLEALSNGVPVLSLSDPAVHKVNAVYVKTFLEPSGLPELVAASTEDFVARALELAADPARLDALRARVRPGFEGGACCDGAGFTRRLEAAFAEMFDAWRARADAAA